ncbi:MAG: hypothetical protein QXP31_04990 [Pyrobaculum sp.]
MDGAYVLSATQKEALFACPPARLYKLWTDAGRFYLRDVDSGEQQEVDPETGRTLLEALAEKLTRTIVIHAQVEKPAKAPWADAVRVEVLQAEEKGARFRLWYYKWFETRPHRPYLDFWIPQGGRGYINANAAEGVYREHLAEIHQLLADAGLPTYLRRDSRMLEFYGGFLKEALRRIGLGPSVRYLGNNKFEVDRRVVEFSPRQRGRYAEMGAVLKFETGREAAEFYQRLSQAGIYAEVAGGEVRLDEESYWGLVVASGAAPEGWQLVHQHGVYIYRKDAAYYFVFTHRGAWRAVGGRYNEKTYALMLTHSDPAVLNTLRKKLAEAYRALCRREGRACGLEVGEPQKMGDVYYILLYAKHLAPFEPRPESADLELEEGVIVVKSGGGEHRVEFKALRGNEAVYLDASIRIEDVAAEPTPRGLRIGREGMWGLLTAAVEKTIAKGKEPRLPPGVGLRQIGDMYCYTTADGQYVFVVKHGGVWRAAGGRRSGGMVRLIHADAAVLEAVRARLNKALSGAGREVGPPKKGEGAYHLLLYNPDLKALGLAP